MGLPRRTTGDVMDFSNLSVVTLLATIIAASTPVLFAAIGEMIVEKSGVLNLGVEGMMIIGAVCGFMAAVQFNSPTLGFVAAGLGGGALSLLFVGTNTPESNHRHRRN